MTLASLCLLDISAVNSSWQSAARIPGIRLAAMEAPIPVPQRAMSLGTSPASTLRQASLITVG